MLDQSRTRIWKSTERPILPSAIISAEGVCLQSALYNGNQNVKPSDGTPNTTFFGFSWGTRFAPSTVSTQVDVLTTDTNGNATLSYTSITAASMGVFVGSGYGGAQLTNLNSGTPSSSQFVLATGGNSITTGLPSTQVMVVYSYNPTVAQQQAAYGDTFPGQTVNAALGSVGIITGGYVYTDQFDPTVNWALTADNAAAHQMCGAANGLVTVGNAVGCLLYPHVEIIQVPMLNSAFLGLYIEL